MKSLFILPFFFGFVINTINAQFDLEWKNPLPDNSGGYSIGQFDIIDDQVLYTLSNKVSYLVDSLGNLVWSFDWNSTFSEDYNLQFLKNNISNKIYFIARHNNRDSVDIVGMLENQTGIIWSASLEGKAHLDGFQGQDFIEFKEGALLIELTPTGNQLIYLSNNIQRIGQKKTDIDSYQNKLSSNGIDKIFWVYNDEAHYFNDSGDILKIDSSDIWNVSVVISKVLLQDEELYCFQSALSDIHIFNSFGDTLIKMPFMHNVFGKPKLEILADENKDVYFSGYNLTGGLHEDHAYLVKLDSEYNVVWQHENHNIKGFYIHLFNLSVSRKGVYYTYENQIRLLNSHDGKLLAQDSLSNNEMFMFGQYNTKSLVPDFKNNAFYTLTYNQNNHYISRYKSQINVGIKNIDNTNSKIYPNPVSGNLFLSSKNIFNKVEIYRMDGALVYSQAFDGEKINTSKIVNGTYLLKLSNSKESMSFKFIKM